ncbi:uncharacterized protein [Argopecten irradians]|uniref:uncharacterized protein n=1 Tax=Argopecten irradians TaxID=31199 RepID=UPI0037145CD6
MTMFIQLAWQLQAKRMPINDYKINKPLKENIDVKTHCKGDSVKETKASYKRTALVSSPGSGNTWTRHLLQQSKYRYFKFWRHPRDSVLSSFHYFNGGLHVEEAKPHLLKTDRWVRFAKERIQFWFDLNNDWITKFTYNSFITSQYV